jgi:hypothetical protein
MVTTPSGTGALANLEIAKPEISLKISEKCVLDNVDLKLNEKFSTF